MSKLPIGLEKVLKEDIYIRKNKEDVYKALKRLDVNAFETFVEFYCNYSGPFWVGNIPFELLDLLDEENRNIEHYTYICRKEHHFPNKFLVLSEMATGTVLVLDSETDKVYKVNFEGGDELLLKGELKETWENFDDFLKVYFNI